MKELPKDRLTIKESWDEGVLETKLTKLQKKNYRKLSVKERRDIIQKFKNNEPFEIPEYKEPEFKDIEKTLKKRGLETLTYTTKETMQKNKVGQFIDDFFSRLSSTMSNPKNSDQMFTYELINQNFTLIKILDDTLKQNETLVRQNEEIIELLKKMSNE